MLCFPCKLQYPCSTCVTAQGSVSKIDAACAHQRPCPANTRMRIQNTLPALDCPSLSGNAASCTPLFTHRAWDSPVYKHTLPPTVRFSCSPSYPMFTKTHIIHLKWNVTPIVQEVSHFWKQWVATVKTNQTLFEIHREAKNQKKEWSRNDLIHNYSHKGG